MLAMNFDDNNYDLVKDFLYIDDYDVWHDFW